MQRNGKFPLTIKTERVVPIARLEKKLKTILYPLIKKRDGNVCTSCGKTGLLGRDHNAGHFIPSKVCNYIYRYDERNINSQCSRCNRYLQGNYPGYRRAMVKKYGVATVNKLEKNYLTPINHKYTTREWLQQKISYYQNINELHTS